MKKTNYARVGGGCPTVRKRKEKISIGVKITEKRMTEDNSYRREYISYRREDISYRREDIS